MTAYIVIYSCMTFLNYTNALAVHLIPCIVRPSVIQVEFYTMKLAVA